MTVTEDVTVTRVLLDWDKRRARSKQRELGMSAIGGCRRRAGYILAGTEPTDPGESMQAVIGTAVDEAVTKAVRGFRGEGLLPGGDLVQHEVRYAGVLGHLDWYRSTTATVDDLKTMIGPQVARVKVHGPPIRHRWQVSLYGAGLIKQGHPVRRIAITCVARDTGEEYRWVAPFDPEVVAEALAWLNVVQSVPVEELNRDHAPDSQPCSWCPFRTRCWGQPHPGRDPRVVLFHENPDAEYWARLLAEARAAKTEATALEEKCKGALDAINPGDDTLVDVGMDPLLRWKKVKQTRLDNDAVRAEYAAAGERPPQKVSWSTRLEFVAREPTDQPITVTEVEG